MRCQVTNFICDAVYDRPVNAAKYVSYKNANGVMWTHK